ncbi:axoneme-associated protein mst101(2)-like [Haliotis rufescens]|uniref:axoneme-associated protein mst101(2)-like n=1 Tax=Haliotis rufescens TaxID=6454 RepID=UPI00201F271C|nr:axoneme-associated protein mst101(2)-like [Haliotis rufescens]
MRTKIDKDVKKKDIVERDREDVEKVVPPKTVKKVKKSKKVETAGDGQNCHPTTAPPDVPTPVVDGAAVEVANEGPDEIAAAVNSITECLDFNNAVPEVCEDVPTIENHVESDNCNPEPIVSTSNPIPEQSELKDAEEQECPAKKPVTPETQTKVPAASVCSYESIIDEVARGDIIVKTPPRKPPKKRRNDDVKMKEKLNFDDSEKVKKNVEKKTSENGHVKSESVSETSGAQLKDGGPSAGAQTDSKPCEAGAKSRSKRTPKKRKFHDEQEDEKTLPVSKPKVTKKPQGSKSKGNSATEKPSDTPAEKTDSPKPKKSPKSKGVKGKAKESKETKDAQSKTDIKEPVKKAKEKKAAKKTKKDATSKTTEQAVSKAACEQMASPENHENAQCSSDSGIGGTDSEMKVESAVKPAASGAAMDALQTTVQTVTSDVPEKMEISELTLKSESAEAEGKSAAKPEAKKKAKSSKPKKPKEKGKEKVNGLTKSDTIDEKEMSDKTKPLKKAKAKKRKSGEGENAEKSEKNVTDGEPSASKEQTAEPSPQKKKKKNVANGDGEVKKVVKKKKKVVKKPLADGEGKENVENNGVGASSELVASVPENGTIGVGVKSDMGDDDMDDDGEDLGGENDKDGEVKDDSVAAEGDSPASTSESKLVNSKLYKEKKILETRECSMCGHKTRGLAALTRHMKRAHQIIRKPPKFKCDRCDFDAAKRVVFAKHMLLHDVIMCFKCPFVCTTQEALEEHVTEEHKNKGDLKLCRLCSRYIRCPEGEDTLEKHMEECKGKVPLVCKECNKEFKYESGLKVHISTHFPDQPKLYTCELCSYQSNYKANLHKHIQNIHQERQKTIKCRECDKMFYKEEHMRRHLRLHAESRPFQCEKCEKAFKTVNAMRCHMESHNTGRPFKCDIDGCSKTFRTAKFLKNHAEELHQLGEKKYHCSAEGCSFSFFKKSHLKRHEITHTGERNYHCTWPECGKSFRHSDNLKVHQRQHTNEKPIKCTMCSFSCRQRNSLQWHIKRHHTQKPGEDSEQPREPPVSGSSENSNEPKVNGVAPTPPTAPAAAAAASGAAVADAAAAATTSEQSTSGKHEKGIDLYDFNDDDSGDDLPVVFRRDKPRVHTLTREALDQLHEAAKLEPKPNPLPEWVKSNGDAPKEETEKAEAEAEKEKEPVKTPPKKKKKKVVSSKKVSPKSVKKVKSPKGTKALKSTKSSTPPKSPKATAAPKTPKSPKSPKSQGMKKKVSPEVAKKKTPVSKKKVSPQSKKAAKKKSPTKKKETKPKGKASVKKTKTKKAAAVEEDKPEEAVEEKEASDEQEKEPEAEPQPVAEPEAEVEAEAEAEIPVEPEVVPEPQPLSPQTLHKPQSPESDDSSPSPHSPHSDRSVCSPLLSDNESEGQPQPLPVEQEEREEEHIEEKQENLEEAFEELEVPPVIEVPKEEAMSPGQAQQEAIDRSLEENPIIDDSTLKDLNSQQDVRQYSPALVEEPEEKIEEQQGDDEEQRVSSDDEVPNDILLTPPRAPAPPPPQSPSEEEEEVEEVMQPVQSPLPAPVSVSVPVPIQEPLSHPEPMSNQPLSNQPLSQVSQDQQQPLPSVEPPKDDAQPPPPPPPPPQPSAQFPHQAPECDKDYLGQYLQDLNVPGNTPREAVPDEPNRLQRLEELAEKPHEDSRDIPRAASVASNVITHTSMQPFHDMSHKRMEILACDRSQEQHFQRDTASALPRLPDPAPFETFNPLNSIHSVSRENNFLRQNENIFSAQTTGSSFMRLGESEAMRQRMTTPFLPQNDRTAISRLPDTALRPTNPALLRRPTTMPSTDMFPTPAMSQTMQRNPFTNTWSGQEVRPPHWPQAPYLQRTIDRQPNTTPATLFAKDNYLASRDFMFDPSRTMTERNMFASLSSPQPQRELAPETFPLELSYFGSHPYSGTATLDYSRPPCGTATKTFDERYRQTAGTAMSDFRGLPQTSSTDVFSGIGVNSSFNLDKYMYPRDPVYHPQHVGDNTNSAFLTHSTPTQHSVFDREYPHRSLYPHQNPPYPFLEERQYSTAAKLTHSAGPTVNQDRDFMARPNTAESQMPPDPYRCGVLYNVMNRYSFE